MGATALFQVALLGSLLCLSSCQECAYTGSLKRSDCRPIDGIDFRFSVIPNDLPSDVETIVLSGNQISTIYPGNLTFYKNLTTLYLDDNLITTFPAGLASTPSSIENLYLDGNPLTQIDDSSFQFFPNIKILNLTRTSLSTLRSEMFTGFKLSIEELHLDNSQLMTLPSYVFDGLNNIKTISIANNHLQTITDDTFGSLGLGSSELKIYLANNPWSCDCNLQWLSNDLKFYASFPEDRSTLRCRWPTTDLMTDLTAGDFITSCRAPNVTVSPQHDSILTDRVYTLTCTVTGAPFPEVTWLKDGVAINYTDEIYLQLYDASLHFSSVSLSDRGVYQCLVENDYGEDNSTTANLIVQEATCFDDVLSRHETDVDCGGVYCKECLQNQTCRVDSDCNGSLVCLYAHSLPSMLHYISPNHQRAYKCDLPQVPRELLETRILNVIDSISVNFTVESDVTDVQEAMTALLAEQLSIPISTFDDVRVTTVERTSAQSIPLVQIWFNLFKTSNGHKGHENLLKQVDDGRMKGTVKIIENNSFFNIRINL